MTCVSRGVRVPMACTTGLQNPDFDVRGWLSRRPWCLGPITSSRCLRSPQRGVWVYAVRVCAPDGPCVFARWAESRRGVRLRRGLRQAPRLRRVEARAWPCTPPDTIGLRSRNARLVCCWQKRKTTASARTHIDAADLLRPPGCGGRRDQRIKLTRLQRETQPRAGSTAAESLGRPRQTHTQRRSVHRPRTLASHRQTARLASHHGKQALPGAVAWP